MATTLYGYDLRLLSWLKHNYDSLYKVYDFNCFGINYVLCIFVRILNYRFVKHFYLILISRHLAKYDTDIFSGCKLGCIVYYFMLSIIYIFINIIIKIGTRLVSAFFIVSLSFMIGVSSFSFPIIFLPRILFTFDTLFAHVQWFETWLHHIILCYWYLCLLHDVLL